MSTWAERCQEEARLFNPSFLGLLAWAAASGHRHTAGRGLPFALAFVILPAVLHKATRQGLPRTTRTSLAAWLHDNAHLRVGFAERAQALAPAVREALLFGITHGLLELLEEGTIVPSGGPSGLPRFVRSSTNEVQESIKRAEFMGKWLASAGSEATVMALWGVEP